MSKTADNEPFSMINDQALTKRGTAQGDLDREPEVYAADLGGNSTESVVTLDDHRARVAQLLAETDSERSLRRKMAVRIGQLSDENKDLKGRIADLEAGRQGELIAPKCSVCNDTGRVKEPGCPEGDCTRCLEAQPATAKVFAGMTLLVADNAPDLCHEDGSAEVFTHADASEVERLRGQVNEWARKWEKAIRAGAMLEGQRDTLRARQAELGGLLREVAPVHHELPEGLRERIDAALSASAEPHP